MQNKRNDEQNGNLNKLVSEILNPSMPDIYNMKLWSEMNS